MSKPSATEQAYMHVIGERMAEGNIRCCCIPKYVAVRKSPSKGPMWETGTGLKAHDWFIIPISKAAHDGSMLTVAWEAMYGPHETLLRAFWNDIRFAPGDYVTVGMETKRAAWMARVIAKL